MAKINKQIGNRIKEFRRKRGLTQEKLASEAGLHRAYIGQIERGEKNIGLKNLEKIANVLKLDLFELFKQK